MAETPAPMIVNPSAVPEAAGTVARDALIVVAAFPIIVKLVGARDLSGLLSWLQSSDGATFLAIVAPILLAAWRSRRSIKARAALVTIARKVDDSVAIVTGPTPPPAADALVAPSKEP